MTPFIPVIPLGPGETDLKRLRRLVASIFRHEPGLERYVVVCDGPDPAAIARELSTLGPTPVTLSNPRNGRGHPIYEGLSIGLTAGYGRVAQDWPGAHVLKLDTDAYVLAPCFARIAEVFEKRPKAGLIGTLDRECDGTPYHEALRRGQNTHGKYLKPIWYWRSTGKITSPYFGIGRKFAKLYRAFDETGTGRGRYVQGGAYAVNGALLATWQANGRLNDPTGWLGSPMGEDVGFAAWTVSDGFELVEHNQRGQIFGVSFRGLPMPAMLLRERGYAIAHSVKAETWEAEQAIVAELDGLVPSPGTLGEG